MDTHFYRIKESNNKFGLTHCEKILIEPIYDDIQREGWFYYKVKIDNLTGLIHVDDKKATKIIDVNYDDIILVDDNYYKIIKNNKSGLIYSYFDTAKWLLDISYDDILKIEKNIYLLTLNNKQGVVQTIYGDIKFLVPVEYDKIKIDKNGFCECMKDKDITKKLKLF